MMQKLVRSRAVVALLCAALSAPALAAPESEPGDGAMVVDLVVARPLGVARTVLGAAVFVVSLPFTALGGGVGDAADTLVVGPAKETFVRCLGCTASSGPSYQDR
jgi:hypothetical protein